MRQSRPSTSIRSSPLLLAAATCAIAFGTLAAGVAVAMDQVRPEIRADLVESVYGLTGRGVTVAILDRGIDWRHPDFIRPDGRTRIKAILDFAPNTCVTTEYSEAQINAALAGTGPGLATRDAVGHGTVTAGAAAGNGRAAASGKYRGLAPEADLLIVKITGGARAHDNEPAEASFYCGVQAGLVWVQQKATALGQPVVVLANVGTQYGPIDGTDSDSRRIDALIGENKPGWIFAIGTGDDGTFPNHAGGSFDGSRETSIPFTIASAVPEYIQIWYSGAVPALVTVAMADGTTVGPVAPGANATGGNGQITVSHPPLGLDGFQSTSGDRHVMINFNGRSGAGEIKIRAQGSSTGRFDAYGYATDNLRFTGLLVPGRISGIAATRTAIVTSVYVNRNTWTDVDGIARTTTAEGLKGQRWIGSSSGPTRDGRSPGCDVAFPGHTGFAAYGRNTEWATIRGNLIQDGQGWYGGYGAASGAAPLLTGAIAQLLQLDPTLTAGRLRQILRQTARADANTGAVPNNDWCYGKVDLYAAALAVADAAGDPGVVEFTSATASGAEGGTTIDVPVRRIGGKRGAVSVQYRVSGGTATDGSDYSAASGTLSWAADETSPKSIRISINDDSVVESSETITLELSSPVAARLGVQRTATVTISDNDVAAAPATPTTPPASGGGGGGGGGQIGEAWLLAALFLFLRTSCCRSLFSTALADASRMLRPTARRLNRHGGSGAPPIPSHPPSGD